MSIYDQYILKARNLLKNKKSKDDDFKVKYKNLLANRIIELIEENQNEILNRNRKYLLTLLNAIKRSGKKVIMIDAETTSKVLVNTESPFGWLVDEVGIDWNIILDTPMIPASTIKGAISTALQIIAINKNIKKKNCKFNQITFLRNIILGVATGETSFISLVDITDAYPVDLNRKINSLLLDRDVMTPIYTRSIREHEAIPTPVQILIIPPGVKFRFLVILDTPRISRIAKEIINENRKYEDLIKCLTEFLNLQLTQNVDAKTLAENITSKIIEIIKEALKIALERIGIGAKTSSGFGILKILEVKPV